MIKPKVFILDVDIMTTGHFIYTAEGKSLQNILDNDGLFSLIILLILDL